MEAEGFRQYGAAEAKRMLGDAARVLAPLLLATGRRRWDAERWREFLAQRVGSGSLVLGIDEDPVRLAEAEEKAEAFVERWGPLWLEDREPSPVYPLAELGTVWQYSRLRRGVQWAMEEGIAVKDTAELPKIRELGNVGGGELPPMSEEMREIPDVWVVERLNHALRAGRDIALHAVMDRDRLAYTLAPKSLIGFMWIQLVEAWNSSVMRGVCREVGCERSTSGIARWCAVHGSVAERKARSRRNATLLRELAGQSGTSP